MEEVLDFSGEEICKLAEKCESHEEAIGIIGNELFSDKVTVVRIAFFFAFIKKYIDHCPELKPQIYENAFECIYKNMKFSE